MKYILMVICIIFLTSCVESSTPSAKQSFEKRMIKEVDSNNLEKKFEEHIYFLNEGKNAGIL